jgi:nicotinamide riboside kinase
MPSPRKKESKNSFISRCIRQLRSENYKQDQAVAICESKWENRNKKNASIMREMSEKLKNIANNI